MDCFYLGIQVYNKVDGANYMDFKNSHISHIVTVFFLKRLNEDSLLNSIISLLLKSVSYQFNNPTQSSYSYPPTILLPKITQYLASHQTLTPIIFRNMRNALQTAQQNAVPVQQPRRQPQQQRGFPICYMILGFLLVQFIGGIYKSYNTSNQQIETQLQAAKVPYVKNEVPVGAELEVMVKVSNSTYLFYQGKHRCKYQSSNELQIPLTLPPIGEDELNQNITVYAIFKTVKPGLGGEIVKFIQAQSITYLIKNLYLTAYKKVTAATRSLYSDDVHLPSNNSKYATMIPERFNILLVMMESPIPTMHLPLKLDYREGGPGFYYHSPPVDMSQLHISKKFYHEPSLNSTQNVTIHIFTFNYYLYLMFQGLINPPKGNNPLEQEVFGTLYSPQTLDELKQVLFENNVYLVILTFFLSTLQSIFQFLAIKNEISFWRNIEKHQGLSLKVLYTNFIFGVVGLLYLIDNDASRLIIFFQILNLAVSVWKIFKTSRLVRTNTFPYVKIQHYDWYKKTEAYDNQAIHYLYYVLVPLFVIYLGYSLVYGQYKGWYSFILETIIGFIYIFGFIQMTPQLYINYKLKSVAHMPWRMLIYRFLNTIIDDLFAFLVTMPWLRRLACFRDDIIFVIYVYQRWIYRVDFNRLENPNDPNLVVNREGKPVVPEPDSKPKVE